MTNESTNKGYLYTFSNNSFGTQGSLKSRSKDRIIKVFIADDHPYLIHGVEADLNKDPQIKIIGSANSYNECLDSCKKLKPDIILLDLRMPGNEKGDLKEVIDKLSAYGSKVVVFSNETGWARIHRCLELGASAYVEKAISLGNLASFIHTVYENNEVLIFTAEQLPQIQFSSRQKQILNLIMEGKENDQISKTLCIELKTVQSYVNEIKGKMSDAFNIHPIRPRTLILLASKLGFGLG